MKDCVDRDSRSVAGVALVIVLVIISAITVVVISYLALIRHETRLSGYEVESLRADLAANAAFADAKNLLLSQVGDDHYLVSSKAKLSGVRSEDGDEMPWRYTFISHPSAIQLRHVPLFSGGERQQLAMPQVSKMETQALAEGPINPPVVNFRPGIEMTNAIETFGLSHLIDARWVAENREVSVGMIEVPPSNGDDPFRVRYAYWIEDLQAYPNLDVGGLWTDHYESDDEEGARSYDQIRLGYARTDKRSLAGAFSGFGGGARIEITGGGGRFGYQFPKSFRGQRLYDQVAPGLSPREMHLYPWPSAPGLIDDHPFAKVAELSAARQSVFGSSALAGATENRFVVGLKPYRERAMIPFGHGYEDEGIPRYNINRLLADRRLSDTSGDGGIIEIIERNLPDFDDERRGGFPIEEDYLATLAASVIDYADDDSQPALPANTSNTGQVFRGIDSYPVINEFFVKFEYVGYEVDGTNFKVKFRATPWVEFWNPSNRPAQLNNLRLKFRILERLQFDGPGFNNTHRLDGMENPAISEDSEQAYEDNLISVLMIPNQFVITQFPDVEWEFEVDRKGTQTFQITPGVYNLSSSGTKRGKSRAHYELYWEDADGVRHKIDQSGRAYPDDKTSPPEHGFFFLPLVDGRLGSSLEPSDMESNGDAQIQSGEYMIRATAPGLGTSKGTPKGSHFGDSWMSYYSAGTQDHEYYTRDASPGGRNFRFDKVEAPSRTDVFRDQQHLLDWPDRGYESDPPPAPAKDSTVTPDAVPAAPNFADQVNFAPWRISNLGRLYSLSELGNIHDPHMWRGEAISESSKYYRNPVSLMRYERMVAGEPLKENAVWDLAGEDDPTFQSEVDSQFGGGSTLRIGRREFALFDRDGVRASQLLDLFQVGEPGTNLPFGSFAASGEFDVDNSADAYAAYDPRDHQPPPSASDEAEAMTRPFRDIYPPDLHAQGKFRRVLGHLNLNAIPTALEIEALIRGPFTSSDILAKKIGPGNVTYTQPDDVKTLEKSLDSDAVSRIAQRLLKARPFYSPSHLARVLGYLLDDEEALPEYYNDAEAEETFARVFNATTLSSRHFRIFTYGEVTDSSGDVVVSRARRVYEVFLRPIRNAAGEIEKVDCEVLSVREL